MIVNKRQEDQSRTCERFANKLNLESTLLTTAQVADYVNVPQPTVLGMIKEQGLPAIRLQRRYRVPRGPFEEWLRYKVVHDHEDEDDE